MEKLRIAIQKSGRLSEKSIALIEESGINISGSQGKLIASASNFPVELLYLRDDDIPQYVFDKVADIGIVGQNGLVESALNLKVVHPLGFSKCRISLAIPKTENYNGPQWFNNKKIATSYPVILQNYLNENGIVAEIHTISGSVEIAPGIGLADAIFDIVSTGSTLISNGLKEVEVAFKSEAVLISSNQLFTDKQQILDELLFRIKAVQKAQRNKYILLNAPNSSLKEIISVLPGMKSPTVMPLAETGWSSVHSVVNEDKFWEVIDKLKALGAEGILVCPIEKMII